MVLLQQCHIFSYKVIPKQGAGAMLGPKAKLLHLSVKVKVPAPIYTFADEKADGKWVCTCAISAMQTITGSIGDEEFIGTAPSKKLAAIQAAELAWTAVDKSCVAEYFEPPEDLVTVVKSALSSKVARSQGVP